MKVYLFYLKRTNELYCYTANKKYKDLFIYQRNKNNFHIKKVKMDDIEFSAFMSKHPSKMLIETPLSTSLTEYEMVVVSYKEEEELDNISTKMDNEMDKLYNDLVVKSDLKNKYKKSLDYLITTSYYSQEKNHKKELVSKANMLRLFTDVFKETFDDNYIEEEDRIK